MLGSLRGLALIVKHHSGERELNEQFLLILLDFFPSGCLMVRDSGERDCLDFRVLGAGSIVRPT
jgi:hypothetical protein